MAPTPSPVDNERQPKKKKRRSDRRIRVTLAYRQKQVTQQLGLDVENPSLRMGWRCMQRKTLVGG